MKSALQLIVLAPLLLMNGCGFLGRVEPEPTLAELEPVALPESREVIPEVSLADISEAYREVLAVTEDPRTRVLVLERLAGLDMMQAETQLAEGEDASELFEQTVDAYRQLLASESGVDRDRLLYQMSRAQDVLGDANGALDSLHTLASDYPNSPHAVEAEFRVAERQFSEGHYAAAEGGYQRVVAAGPDTPYYLNALYMRGWALFKQGDYRRSIAPFSRSLDQLLPENNQLDSLSAADRALVDDCFRALAVVFSYLEGVATIAAAYDALGHRSYEPLLYEALGELYLKQERYRDSAETFRAFSRSYPGSEFAHRFHVRVIGIYEQAGFPDLIIAEKRDYVAAYSVEGDYFLVSERDIQQEIAANLSQFIDELATHYHALAQDGVEPLAHFRLAGDYYQLYIDSFPGDERVPHMGFLLAETRSASGDMERAVATFEWVAYDFPEYERAAEAGYAAIVGYAPLLDSAGDDSVLRRKIDSQLRFVTTFAGDSHTPAVLNDAAASLYSLSEYQLAILVAATLAGQQPPAELLIPSNLVIAHSWFELDAYLDAASAYRAVLDALPRSDARYESTVEGLAASLYRRAEQLADAGETLAAAEQFEQVMVEAPAASFRRQAQFDAAQYFMDAGEWSRANRLLEDFRQRFRGDELASQVPLKLVYNFEQLEEWELAAVELDALVAGDPASEAARDMLYIAAEHYDRAGNTGLAIARYRSYAHQWEQPMGPRLEAMRRLAEIYDAENAQDKRRFWLRKTMAAHDGAGDSQTDRSRYLAARASSIFADDHFRAFGSVGLQHPVEKSLKKKRRRMQEALDAYQQTHDYGVAEFASLATYRMAEIYRQLGVDLLQSQRPEGLDALALEQYELLLEEQAYPFEEKAIAIHEANMRRSWEGWYDGWIRLSFDALAELSPARYAKRETALAYSEGIY